MGQIPDEAHGFEKMIFYLLYCLGVSAGVAAKLAVMARSRNINFKDVAINTTIAFSAAFGAFFIMKRIPGIDTNIKLFVSVFLGRFADDIWAIAWDGFKTLLKSWAKK